MGCGLFMRPFFAPPRRIGIRKIVMHCGRPIGRQYALTVGFAACSQLPLPPRQAPTPSVCAHRRPTSRRGGEHVVVKLLHDEQLRGEWRFAFGSPRARRRRFTRQPRPAARPTILHRHQKRRARNASRPCRCPVHDHRNGDIGLASRTA